MAENGKLVIPKFKDKTVYYTTDTTETSYPVSASYKGILRLSPNDDASLAEAQIEDIIGSEVEEGNYFIDPIDNFVDKQFIRISTSDGFLLDMRLTEFNIEFDNLYVRGPIKTDVLRVYTKTNTTFDVDGLTYLPDTVNKSIAALVAADGGILNDISPSDEQYQPYILVSRNTDERKFEYQQFNSLVENAIMDVLMDVCSLPTGSIHFAPITIKAYNALLMKGKPNKFYCDERDSNGNLVPNSPIVRDFLLCDGSLYNNTDFPELAKILEGEIISYWVYDGSQKMMVLKKHKNDYTESKTFRVPDLRHSFLRSLYPDIQYADAAWNQTGSWNVDVRPKLTEKKNSDQHVHFIASGFYTGSYKSSGFKNVESDGAVTDYAGVMAPTSNDLYWGGGHLPCNYRCPVHGNYKVWNNIGSCSYTLCTPSKYDYQSNNMVANMGKSSENFLSVIINPTSDEDLKYNDRDDYVSLLDDNPELYGMENAPEHYCALPLIKI